MNLLLKPAVHIFTIRIRTRVCAAKSQHTKMTTMTTTTMGSASLFYVLLYFSNVLLATERQTRVVVCRRRRRADPELQPSFPPEWGFTRTHVHSAWPRLMTCVSDSAEWGARSRNPKAKVGVTEVRNLTHDHRSIVDSKSFQPFRENVMWSK